MSAPTREKKPRGGAARLARRAFLIGAGLTGGGLLLGAGVVGWRLAEQKRYRLPEGPGEHVFGAWLKLAADGRVEVVAPHQDMGQGIYALAALLVAEGLSLAPDAVRVSQAPIAPVYANPVMLMDGVAITGDTAAGRAALWTLENVLRAVGVQATGGSSSTRNIETPIRRATASLRDLFARAAESRLGAPATALAFDGGAVVAPGGARATFAELAPLAATLAPREIDPGPLRPGALVGLGAPRPDVPDKTRGLARYGIDARLPGQIFAAIAHSPRLGGRLKSAVLEADIPDVAGIVEGPDWVAVAAKTTGIAFKALEAMKIEWDDAAASDLGPGDPERLFAAALDERDGRAKIFVQEAAGDPAGASGEKVRARYYAPYLAHMTMEPMNATALVREDGTAQIHAGNQSPQLARLVAAGVLGLPQERIEIVTPWLGGGFGRRADMDFVAKACAVAAKFPGVPVQTVWSRAQDMRDDFLRPAALCEVEARVDSSGLPASFVYRIATPSIVGQFSGRLASFAKGGLTADRSQLDGALALAYGLPNRRIESLLVDPGPGVGFWRSVGFSLNCFFVESFVDELAAKAGVKPLDYRLRLLAAGQGREYAGERAMRAMTILRRMAAFDAEHPLAPREAGDAKGRMGRGFALTAPFHSHVGQIADVEIVGEEIRLRRVHAVVDCGFAVDARNVVAQVRSGVIFGAGAALYGKIDFENGAPTASNFDGFPILALEAAPEISVEIVNSGAEIGGVGEIGTPAIAPAMANAIFAAVGKRLRRLPFSLGA